MIGDTILAVSSPPGAGARGVLRISGPDAIEAARRVLRGAPSVDRGATENVVHVAGRGVPCLVLVMPGPASFTGEDTVELHLPGSPILLELVQQKLLDQREHGLALRRAEPGEFTRRAFESGRIDLAESEAVLQLIDAGSRQEAAFATQILRGGLREQVDGLRNRLLDARAILEAGLDFTDEETGAVSRSEWEPLLLEVRDGLRALLSAMPQSGGGASRLFLVGAANAGKSSLANALAGRDLHLVDNTPGTTRDVLAVEIEADGRCVTLHDGPGDLAGAADIDAASLALRDRWARQAAGLIVVLDSTTWDGHVAAWLDRARSLGRPLTAVVFSKRDLVGPRGPGQGIDFGAVPVFHTSSVTAEGLTALRAFLLGQAASGPSTHAARLRRSVEAALAALGRALQTSDASNLEELVALDLQAAATALDQVHGRTSPEEVLDRIFAGFCLGK